MIQAWAALVGAAVTAAACYALGCLLIDFLGAEIGRDERVPLAFVLGAALLHLAVFAVLALKIAYAPVVIALVLLPLPWARLRGGKPKPLSRPLRLVWGGLFAVFTVLYFFHAWAPESSPDGSGYHLGLVARYLRAHGFERITTDILASLSQGVEMLFVPAFAIGRHSAGALVHLAFAVALALAILAYGRRIGKPWVGAAAALLTYASPVVGIDGSSAYNDVAVAAVVFAAFYWLEIWDQSRDARLLVAVGLLAGYAYAVKYTAFVMLPFALVWVFWRARKLKELALVTACSLVMMTPWMIKNWIYVDNPVAPFGNAIFRNPYVHVQFERDLGTQMRSYNIDNKWTLPLEVTLWGQKTQGVIGAAFLAAPVALLALREARGRRLLAAGAVLLAVYFTNLGTRFLIPCLPFFSLAMALALGNATPLLALLMIFHSAASWPAELRRHAARYSWRLDAVLYKQALRIIPEERYLRENFAPYSQARLVEANVPAGERVLAFTAIPEAYTSRDVIVAYRSAFGEDLKDILDVAGIASYQPRVHQTFRFTPRPLRQIRVVQTARPDPPQQWSVHELRFYRAGVELPRRPEWRLRARPNPWDVQLAFDNSPVTRWRTWEPAAPGMYLDVDFGREETVDEVRVETSPDQPGVRVALEGIAADPQIEMVEPAADLSAAAAQELRSRGIRYLLRDGVLVRP